MLVLVGFMGAGKTTVGRLVADRLGLPFIDSDLVIEHRTGKAVRDLFAEEGERAFRDLEHQVVAELVGGPDAVVALGGGAVEHEGTRRVLQASPAQVVYLRVGWEQALGRLGDDPARPMLRAPDLRRIYERRLAWYEEVATWVVPTDGRTPREVGATIIERARALVPAPAAERSGGS
ncbi:shikimate kinase [Aciditerrimonas ferrireducens]|uniref:Shikimate kinase n=1 Tax=Aciditerrimonas ferrireducens TaxID=667306 RepID=A0ABV6C2C1_9ACTN|nr:shikimate kinase [Aciditerrimonas ferrireducens]MCK4177720.1 shikimate kinase [Aciditerrimonas ferrireducens]